MTIPPEWIHEFETLINPASVVLAGVLPFIRVGIRRYRGKVFKRSYLVHDAMAGFALPSFVTLCMLPVAPTLREHLEAPHLFLAGVLGIIFVLTELVSPDGDEDDLDECRRATLGLCHPTVRQPAAETSPK